MLQVHHAVCAVASFRSEKDMSSATAAKCRKLLTFVWGLAKQPFVPVSFEEDRCTLPTNWLFSRVVEFLSEI